MSPLIAITGNYSSGMCTMLEGYFASVAAAGGSPVIIPPYADEALMDSLLEHIDGLILSGGLGLGYAEERGAKPNTGSYRAVGYGCRRVRDNQHRI